MFQNVDLRTLKESDLEAPSAFLQMCPHPIHSSLLQPKRESYSRAGFSTQNRREKDNSVTSLGQRQYM